MEDGQSDRRSRPDPDALLALVGGKGRGRLRVFLGAAPGVGKTYAMLSGAHQRRREGIDLVVGLAETHGRAETEALLAGLEILPRRPVPYRGRMIQEFDLDAALARHPKLIVIDELAHRNAPDCRHPKRYQDVEEILSAGIDVWTALNIQHLESLSDVVSRITGVRVRETVPDTVIEKADEVVVVDITPAELIQRLSDGKVYLPATARRAAENFFKPGNLTALRELALRRTADRVDDQMVDYLRQNAIEGAWPSAERIMVCVGADSNASSVVRAAGRLANGLNASWIAVTLERVGEEVTDPAKLRRVDEAMLLAERLGAETARLTARDLPEEILRFARHEHMTQIVMGRSRGGLLARLRRRSLTSRLIARATDIAIHVVVPEGPEERPAPRRTFELGRYWVWLGTAVAAVAGAVWLGHLALAVVELPDLSMIFLAAVLLCAVTAGMRSAIAAAFLSFLAYNFFFIPPVYTLTVAEPREFVALLVFLLVGILTGGLAARVREQSKAAWRRVVTTQGMFDFARKLSGTVKLDDVLWVVVAQAARAVNGEVVILMPKDGELGIRASYPPQDALGPGEWGAARWAFTHNEPAGWRSDTLPNAAYRFRPLRTSRGTLGVIGIMPIDRDQALPAEQARALDALIDQAAIAIERTLLVAEATESQAAAETERLRAALLSSISHDLRTPLASILGSVTSLRQLGDLLAPADRDDLLSAIEEETGRLSRFVSNLLDMTRLEAGALDLTRAWVDLGDAARAAAARAAKLFPERELIIAIDPDLPPVRGEAGLIEQVMFNLLDNTHRYSPAGTPTAITVTRDAPDRVSIVIEDEGIGIPPDAIDRVFEKFYRVAHGDGRPPGTGLGLSICRGIVQAMDGTITANSPGSSGKGTRITIRLPLSPEGTIDP